MNVNVCSFCNKHKDQVQKLIVSETVAICNECINLCQELLQDPLDEVKPSSDNCQDPKQIKSFLDEYIIGQDQAKIALSVAVVNHYKRLRRKECGKNTTWNCIC
jgi:ATP-dependent Clp protease ATP-binding subunit ClpX